MVQTFYIAIARLARIAFANSEIRPRLITVVNEHNREHETVSCKKKFAHNSYNTIVSIILRNDGSHKWFDIIETILPIFLHTSYIYNIFVCIAAKLHISEYILKNFG